MLDWDWLDVVGVVEVTCARGSLVSHMAVPGHTHRSAMQAFIDLAAELLLSVSSDR